MSSAIHADHITAAYGDRHAVHDVSFELAEGDMAALLGPNGAGKTTLLRVLTGLLRPVRGTVRLFGRDINTLSSHERAALVGVVPQELQIPMPFPVRHFVMMGRTASLSRWLPPSQKDIQIVERAMAYTDTVHLKDRPISELSGGERQRAIVAMVLAQQPRIILMDEATSHLDMNHCLEVMQIVERMNREENVTVLMVSHDLNLSAEFCRRLLLLEQGRLVADGAPATVLNEETLRRVYRCNVRVQKNPASGSVIVTPSRRLVADRSRRGFRIHVIAGGGCGEDCLRSLTLCDYTVTCGVLNQADSDADVAKALGLEVALEKPFSHIGQPALDKARNIAATADAVVICGVPFGPGNTANLALAREALARGKRVLVMDGVEERDFTPDREATRAVQELLRGGAVTWRNEADLLDALPKSDG
ncbi:MAG: ABC transporter ATP-binding protein [bacterium]